MGTDMPDTTHLSLRGRTWWYIRKVPPALRPKMIYPLTGKALYRVNLKTSDLLLAQRKRPAMNAAFDAELDLARKRRDGVEGETLMAEATALRRWAAEPHDEEERLSREAIAQDVAQEKAERTEERLGEDFAARFYQTATGTRPGTEIAAHLEAFKAENPARAHTQYKREKVINALNDWRSQLFIETITHEVARGFVEEVLAPGRKAETINSDLGILSSYWKWVGNHRIGRELPNHWTRLRRKQQKRPFEDLHRPYTDDEMRRLLYGETRMRKDVLDCALVSALTSARLEEAGRLKVKHIDLAALTIFLPGTKTEAAPRKLPVHPDLVPVLTPRIEGKGPEDWVFHELPDRKADALKGRASKVSQAFTRFRRSVGVGHTADDGGRSPVDFHSFRRWFAASLKMHGTPPYLIEGICGWMRADMLTRYTRGADPLDLMREAIAKVKLPTPLPKK